MNQATRPLRGQKLGVMQKPRKWSHQDDLEQNVGQQISFTMDAETYIEGILLAADQFTIKVEVGIYIETHFKHAILSYFFRSGK